MRTHTGIKHNFGGTSSRWQTFLRGIKPFLFFGILTFIFGGLGPGATVFQLGPLHWSAQSLESASYFALRLIVIGIVSVGLMTLLGFNRILRWLYAFGRRFKPFGKDVTPILFSMALAIRFLPVLQEETAKLELGWQARGARLMGRGPLGFFRRLKGLAIPLVAASFRRAEGLSDVLQLRMQAEQSGHGLPRGQDGLSGHSAYKEG